MTSTYSSFFFFWVTHSNFLEPHLRSTIIWYSYQPIHSQPKWLAISSLLEGNNRDWECATQRSFVLYFCSVFWSISVDFTNKKRVILPSCYRIMGWGLPPWYRMLVFFLDAANIFPTWLKWDINHIILVNHHEVGYSQHVCLMFHCGWRTSPTLLVNLAVVTEIGQFSHRICPFSSAWQIQRCLMFV